MSESADRSWEATYLRYENYLIHYDVIDTTGLLFAIFYVMTALATIVYYRRRVVSSVRDFFILGVLPLGAAGFLGWMFEQSVQTQAT